MAYEFYKVSSGYPVTSQAVGENPDTFQPTADLGLTLACLAVLPDAAKTSALKTLLSSELDSDTQTFPVYAFPAVTDPLDVPRITGLAPLYAHLWAMLGLSTTAGGVPAALVSNLLPLVQRGAVIFQTSKGWATFKFGDGTKWGEKLDTAYVMRESALAGLILYNEAVRLGDADLLQAAFKLALGIGQIFRKSGDDGFYATVVSRGAASSQQDAEAFALAGLLSLRFNLHTQTAELLAQVERACVGRVSAAGFVTGYSGASPYVLSARSTALVAAFYFAASKLGMARTALRGVQNMRLLSESGVIVEDGVRMWTASMAADVAYLPGFLRGTP